ncbi:LOW QUALITY PROTEIN: protein mono-ADP-ribosyltransferase PARP4-like [Saccostrea echinata]|uniref:LOW QUALITY PROTEIN: protein mono-ADP-ribosyltransferase PARP4-like n=1 Tax=Saccostrea echinata TaxID=191078 RepID=UPI002A815DF3|nr:LOW QUALITY PROTEIN: protein mono-ADP-ribosyltransferase PARP4-like [Saccostrea echinata]
MTFTTTPSPESYNQEYIVTLFVMTTEKIFAGCQVVLDLSTSVGFKKKQEVRKTITNNGGIISYIVTKKSTHVVLNDPEKADVSYKCKMAEKFGIPVVSLDFIFDCVDQGKHLNTDDYLLVGKTKGLEFSRGKIMGGKFRPKSEGKKKKMASSFNPKSVKVWQGKDKNIPQFDDESEVAKYALLQKYDKKTQLTQFCVLEILASKRVIALDNKEQSPGFCICSHLGSVQEVQDLSEGSTREFRFVQTSEEALGMFSALYKQMTESPNGMTVCRKPPCQHIGTKKFQKMMVEYGMEDTELSTPVRELMHHIWQEAGGEIEEILSSPLQSLKLDQVEKAMAILSEMKAHQSHESKLQSLFTEFYSTLPHNPQHKTMTFTMSWLARKLDLCQIIKDVVSASEATDWSTRGNAEAQYKALRCQISHVPGGLPTSVKKVLILKDEDKMNVENVYSINRAGEGEVFRSDLDHRFLFHASNVENFVGILSRGLLMPKVVVYDYGGKRTDPGMLGNGIYFASSASTSIKYSKPSKTRNTRMMLVNLVALGNTMDVYTYQRDLTAPPSGYDSVHGVAASEGVESDFKDDEYVVYNTNQQMLSYLVEFTVGGELPVELSMEEELEGKTPDSDIDVDIRDVQKVADPLTKVKVGLVSNDETPVFLKEVHIRAKLIDLAGEVVVLQEYHNNRDKALEAKYVFPLDDMAAVCGFEAFINGKHIIGEVKEKETAHKEYKKAIKEGHGAYLMDQDQETPEMFTVSVGNLPPKATVIIKITYVTELQAEGELINFYLPGSVAPWKQKYVDAPEFKDKDWDTVQVADTDCSVQVYVDMPFDIRSLECPTHKILVKKTATKATVSMKEDQIIKDGFQLLIGLAEIHVPRMWVESDELEGSQACMLTFYPEFDAEEESEVEVILMIDSSNSMKGSALQQAKKAALLTLHLMESSWRFNVVSFGTAFLELFPSSQTASKFNIQAAKLFIQKLQADQGNTELCRPLNSYYLLKPESYTRNIFLISDGHINNEEAALSRIAQNHQHTRVFTLGVSSVANRHLLKAVARVGAGSFEFYDSKLKSKWEEKIKSQLQKAAQPVLTSVSVDWRHDDQHPAPIQAPQQISALFSGSRQVIYGFVDNCYMATLKAEVEGQEISTVVSTSDLNVTKGKMLHRLAAKGVIRDWEDGVLSPDRTGHEVKKMNLKQYIIELSKKYTIVTSLTSFVAIEKREKDEVVPENAPDIWTLLEHEDLDQLKYLSWEGEDEELEEEEFRDGSVEESREDGKTKSLISAKERSKTLAMPDNEVPEMSSPDLKFLTSRSPMKPPLQVADDEPTYEAPDEKDNIPASPPIKGRKQPPLKPDEPSPTQSDWSEHRMQPVPTVQKSSQYLTKTVSDFVVLVPARGRPPPPVPVECNDSDTSNSSDYEVPEKMSSPARKLPTSRPPRKTPLKVTNDEPKYEDPDDTDSAHTSLLIRSGAQLPPKPVESPPTQSDWLENFYKDVDNDPTPVRAPLPKETKHRILPVPTVQRSSSDLPKTELESVISVPPRPFRTCLKTKGRRLPRPVPAECHDNDASNSDTCDEFETSGTEEVFDDLEDDGNQLSAPPTAPSPKPFTRGRQEPLPLQETFEIQDELEQENYDEFDVMFSQQDTYDELEASETQEVYDDLEDDGNQPSAPYPAPSPKPSIVPLNNQPQKSGVPLLGFPCKTLPPLPQMSRQMIRASPRVGGQQPSSEKNQMIEDPQKRASVSPSPPPLLTRMSQASICRRRPPPPPSPIQITRATPSKDASIPSAPPLKVSIEAPPKHAFVEHKFDKLSEEESNEPPAIPPRRRELKARGSILHAPQPSLPPPRRERLTIKDTVPPPSPPAPRRKGLEAGLLLKEEPLQELLIDDTCTKRAPERKIQREMNKPRSPLDVTPLHIGLEDAEGNLCVIIARDSKIPCENKQRNILPSSRGKDWIEVTIAINIDGIITVIVYFDPGVKGLHFYFLKISNAKSRMSPEEMEHMLKEADEEKKKTSTVSQST